MVTIHIFWTYVFENEELIIKKKSAKLNSFVFLKKKR